MREYERNEPTAKVKVPSKPRPPKRPKVNKAAVVLGDPLVVLGGFLRVFSRKR